MGPVSSKTGVDANLAPERH